MPEVTLLGVERLGFGCSLLLLHYSASLYGAVGFPGNLRALQRQSLHTWDYPQDSGVWGVGGAAPTPLHAHLPLFLQTLSMLPTRILRLLEFVGFSGNKVTTCFLGPLTCPASRQELS